MIKIRVSPSVSPFQVDFPAKHLFKGDREAKELKRSVKDNGSVNFRRGSVVFVTNDEWEYLKEKREDLIGSSLILLGEVEVKKKSAKKEKAEAGPKKDSKSGGEKKPKDSGKK